MMILEDIEKLLEYSDITEPIFLGTIPVYSGSPTISLFVSGGYTPGLKDIEEPTFQVRIRHEHLRDGYALINKIKKEILSASHFQVEDREYIEFFQTSDIAQMGKDENNLEHLAINFRTYRQEKEEYKQAKLLVDITEKMNSKELYFVTVEYVAENNVRDKVLKDRLDALSLTTEQGESVELVLTLLELSESSLSRTILNYLLNYMAEHNISDFDDEVTRIEALITAEEQRLIQEKQALVDAIATRDALIEDKNGEITSLESSLSDTTATLNQKIDEIVTLEGELESLQGTVYQLNLDIITIQNSEDALEEDLAAMMAQRDALQLQLDAKLIEIGEKEAEIDDLILLVSSLEGEVLSLNQQVLDLQTEMANMTSMPEGWGEISTGIAVGNVAKYEPVYLKSDWAWEITAEPIFELSDQSFGNDYYTAFSPDGNYFAVGFEESPYISIYKRDGDSFIKLTNPSTLPLSAVKSLMFSPDSNYLVAGGYNSPYINIYKRNGDVFTKLPNPSVLPTSGVTSIAFSPDGNNLGLGIYSSPYLNYYKRNGDVFTKLANQSVLPTGRVESIAFSPNNSYLITGGVGAPYLNIYKRDGDALTKLPNPDFLPTSTVNSVSFSPDGHYFAVGTLSGQKIIMYRKDVGSFIGLPDSTLISGGTVYSIAFAPTGNYLAAGVSGNNFVFLFSHRGNILVKLGIPILSPDYTKRARFLTFSPCGKYLAVSNDTDIPYVSIYKTELRDIVQQLTTKSQFYLYVPNSGKLGFALDYATSGQPVDVNLFPKFNNLP